MNKIDLVQLRQNGESIPTSVDKALKDAKSVKVCVGIVGTKPMLLSPSTPQVIADLRGGAGKRSTAAKKEMTSQQICAEKIIRYLEDLGIVVFGCGIQEVQGAKINLDNLPIGIPIGYMLAALRYAGRKVTLAGKVNVSKSDGSTELFSLVEFHDDFLPFKDQEAASNWLVDVQKGNLNNMGKKTAVPLERPLIRTGWGFDVNITIDTSQYGMDKIMELFTKAGKISGLCAFRPACGGRYGQFAVNSWQILEIDGKKVEQKTEKVTSGNGQLAHAEA